MVDDGRLRIDLERERKIIINSWINRLVRPGRDALKCVGPNQVTPTPTLFHSLSHSLTLSLFHAHTRGHREKS